MRPGRARAGAILLAALALASLSVRGSPYHEFDRQQGTSGALAFAVETNLRAAQSFVPTADFTATRVGLYVNDTGRDDALSVSLVPDAGGRPSASLVLGSGTNNSGPAFEWANFTLAPGVALRAGTRYWILADDNGGTGEGYLWRYEAADAYARGNASTATGGAWTTRAGDFAFTVYGWSAANVTATVTAGQPSVAGGDSVSFSIRFSNSGTELGTDAWVNATLDPRLQFVSAGPGPVALSGDVVTFQPPTIANGTTLYVNATAAGVLQDNGTLVLPVTAEFFDGAARASLATSAALATRAPAVAAQLDVTTVTTSAVDPGAIVTFEVSLRNRGQAVAGHVWVNESLHRVLTYLSDTSPAPPTVDAEHQSWHFSDLGPGSLRFNVTVQVDPTAVGDTVVATFLSVEFTDPVGSGLLRGRSNTILFRVIGEASANPWLWGSFAISATIVGGTYVGFVRRRLRTEEIFLIHHSGVLLVHMSKTMKADHDSDILSGMFTAIMNFVRDAFHYEGRQELHGMDLGEYRVHVRKGGITYLALVHTGKPTRWIAKLAAASVQEIESQYGELLREWDGDTRALGGVRELLKGYFLSPTGPSRSMRWARSLLARADATFKPMRPL